MPLKLLGSKFAWTNWQTAWTERPASFETLRKCFAPQDEGLEQVLDLTDLPATKPHGEERSVSNHGGLCSRELANVTSPALRF